MDIHEWLELICQVGTLIFAALTYFKDKKQAVTTAPKL